ncbi:MAG TPA: hypothetical protein VF490_21140 [Chryseosolibacter sp.]
MKTGLLLFVVTLLSLGPLSGKIINAYEKKLECATETLQRLNRMLQGDHLTSLEKANLRSRIKLLMSFLSYRELTEKLINQLRAISPDLYNEIDNITDKRGRPTDVYIRLVPKGNGSLPLQAFSLLSRATVDEDASHSEYGDYSVSIDVQIGENALMLLYHELGHVHYIIPNLATYQKFYEARHRNRKHNPDYFGHDIRDASGQSANAFVKIYLRDKAKYIQTSGERPSSALVLLQRIEKNNKRLAASLTSTAIVSTASDRPAGGLPGDFYLR